MAAWLIGAGWRIVGRRLRSTHGGEVDLVAVDPGRVLVAVEVRARASPRAGSALESVDARRVQRLRRTLVAHASSAGTAHSGLRVDLVGVEPDPSRPGLWRLRRVAGIG